MRWAPLTLRISAGIISILVVIILIVSIIPLVSGDLEVKLSENASDISLQDGTLIIEYPVEVYNGGYFDIDDVRISITLDDDEFKLTSSSEVMKIRAGMINQLNPSFSFDLRDVELNAIAPMVFEHRDIDLIVDIKGMYALGTIGASISYTDVIEWEPLIDRNNLKLVMDTVPQDDEELTDVFIKNSFGASPIIQDSKAKFDLELKSGNKKIGDGSDIIILAVGNDGNIAINLPQDIIDSLTDKQEFTLILTITVDDIRAEIEEVIYWEGLDE